MSSKFKEVLAELVENASYQQFKSIIKDVFQERDDRNGKEPTENLIQAMFERFKPYEL